MGWMLEPGHRKCVLRYRRQHQRADQQAPRTAPISCPACWVANKGYASLSLKWGLLVSCHNAHASCMSLSRSSHASISSKNVKGEGITSCSAKLSASAASACWPPLSAENERHRDPGGRTTSAIPSSNSCDSENEQWALQPASPARARYTCESDALIFSSAET